MRNEDFNSEGKTNSGSSSGTRHRGGVLASAAMASTDSDDVRQRHLDKQREIERAKGKSRMGGVLARASAKPSGNGGERGSGAVRKVRQFSAARQQVAGPDTLDLNLGRYGRSSSARNGESKKKKKNIFNS